MLNRSQMRDTIREAAGKIRDAGMILAAITGAALLVALAAIAALVLTVRIRHAG